jgi:transposase
MVEGRRSKVESLESLRDWLKDKCITHIAMESKYTGNPLQHPLCWSTHDECTQKTDKKDSIWIAKLLLSGLLKGSFIGKET